ncbi:hypothetical protein D3C87_1831040 [compost metagenome]
MSLGNKVSYSLLYFPENRSYFCKFVGVTVNKLFVPSALYIKGAKLQSLLKSPLLYFSNSLLVPFIIPWEYPIVVLTQLIPCQEPKKPPSRYTLVAFPQNSTSQILSLISYWSEAYFIKTSLKSVFKA